MGLRQGPGLLRELVRQRMTLLIRTRVLCCRHLRLGRRKSRNISFHPSGVCCYRKVLRRGNVRQHIRHGSALGKRIYKDGGGNSGVLWIWDSVCCITQGWRKIGHLQMWGFRRILLIRDLKYMPLPNQKMTFGDHLTAPNLVQNVGMC